MQAQERTAMHAKEHTATHARSRAHTLSSCLQEFSMPKLADAANCHACILTKPLDQTCASIPPLHA